MLTGPNEPRAVASSAQAMAKVRRRLRTKTNPFIFFHFSYKMFFNVIANVM